LGTAVVAACLFAPATALADDWFPHPDGATWTYTWSDSLYSLAPTTEALTVKENKGKAFTLAWDSTKQGNAASAAVSTGEMSFQETNAGLFNTGWSSSAPPVEFPVLCAKSAGCNNTIAATMHLLIWGSRGPVLEEPLLNGMEWDSSGGASNDVTSSSSYEGTEQVTVPAFPQPLTAAKIRTDISQAGALGDPFGSGVRYTWWVRGVGPVKIEFDHTGGAVTTSVLQSTNQTPQDPLPDVNYFPLTQGLTSTYKWTNPKWLRQAAVEQFHVDAELNESATISVKSISGPINMTGAYGFTLRTDGVTTLWARTQTSTTAKLPALGPKALPVRKRRHFFTPYDLMTFGFNPLIPAYPTAGQSWQGAATGRDFSVYGVLGTTTVDPVESVTVPAGTYDNALKVESDLTQDGFPAGSGHRTMWFAPDVGLVKLVWTHGDGSTSTIVLTKQTQPS
jgi:hypothetical protein